MLGSSLFFPAGSDPFVWVLNLPEAGNEIGKLNTGKLNIFKHQKILKLDKQSTEIGLVQQPSNLNSCYVEQLHVFWKTNPKLRASWFCGRTFYCPTCRYHNMNNGESCSSLLFSHTLKKHTDTHTEDQPDKLR